MNFELLKKENILHDYEQVRLRNKRRLQERQEEIYAKIPEIKQLQSESKLSYIALAKKKALGQAADTQEISNQNRSNSARIQELLLTHGYPATYLEPIYDCPVCKDLAYVDGKVCACFERRIVDALYRQSNMTQVLDSEPPFGRAGAAAPERVLPHKTKIICSKLSQAFAGGTAADDFFVLFNSS